jgi:hypothetical protein
MARLNATRESLAAVPGIWTKNLTVELFTPKMGDFGGAWVVVQDPRAEFQRRSYAGVRT